MGLFRSEVIEAQRERLHGQVVLLPRWPHTLVCLFLLLWVSAALIFLTQASYSRKASVRGWLEPVDGLVQVYAQSEGRLAKLLVEPGDHVVAEQPLAVINGDRVLEDGAQVESILLQEYEQQKAVLEGQLARESHLTALRRDELLTAIDAVEAAAAAITRQRQTLVERKALGDRRLERHQQLAAQGHLTQAELDALREQALQLAGDQQSLETEQLRQEAQLSTLRAELSRLPQESGNAVDRLKLSLSDLSQEIARLRGSRAHVVQASVAGTVSRIALQPGQRAMSQEALVTLLPEGSPLVAQLLVPVRASGFLSPGQKLLIRYDAFPYQKYGLQEGVLTSVSDSAVLPRELARFPISAGEAVFRAAARPEQTSLLARGEKHKLKAGMTFSADIVLEHRSLLEWLLEPLLSLRGRLR